MLSKNQLSFTLMATGIFLLFYNLGSIARIATAKTEQSTQQAQLQVEGQFDAR